MGNSLMNRVKNNDCIESERGKEGGWYSSFELVYCRPFNGTSIRLQYQTAYVHVHTSLRFFVSTPRYPPWQLILGRILLPNLVNLA